MRWSIKNKTDYYLEITGRIVGYYSDNHPYVDNPQGAETNVIPPHYTVTRQITKQFSTTQEPWGFGAQRFYLEVEVKGNLAGGSCYPAKARDLAEVNVTYGP